MEGDLKLKHDACQKSIDDLSESLWKGEDKKENEDKLIHRFKNHFLNNIIKL